MLSDISVVLSGPVLYVDVARYCIILCLYVIFTLCNSVNIEVC